METENWDKLLATVGGSLIAVVFTLGGLWVAASIGEHNTTLAVAAALGAVVLPIFAATRVAYRAGFDAGKRVREHWSAPIDDIMLPGSRPDERFRRSNNGRHNG
jgi:apolipoprotein N-acyltransferase